MSISELELEIFTLEECMSHYKHKDEADEKRLSLLKDELKERSQSC